MTIIFDKGDERVLKKEKAIISVITFGLILLVGCSGEQDEEQVQAGDEVLKNEQEEVAISSNEDDDEILNLMSQIEPEIIVSVAERSGLEKDSIAIMLGGGGVESNIDVSVGLPKDENIDDSTIQQISKDIFNIVSKTDGVTISEEDIEITRY